MDRSEDYILNKPLTNPLCSMVIERDGAKVTLEQSLELTWSGPVEECRKLLGLVLPEEASLRTLSQLKLLESSETESVYGTTTQGATITFYMRGERHQASALLRSLLKFGGLEYFDLAVRDRGLYR